MFRESTTAASVLVPIVIENRFPSLDQAVPNSDSPVTAIPTAPRIAARNVEGIELAYGMIFAPVIESRDQDHHAEVPHLIAELKTMLAERDLRQIDQEKLRALSEEIVLTLQMTAPAIALARPTLEFQ